MDKFFNKLEELVFKEKFTIRAINLTDLFDLHTKQAQFLLESFAEKNKNLIVKYGLIGYQSEPDDDVGARRYIEIEKDEIENEKKNFTKLISCTIKSIKEKDNLLNREYNLRSQKLELNKDDVIEYQKKGFYLNKNYEFREKLIEDLFTRIEIKNVQNGLTTKQNNTKRDEFIKLKKETKDDENGINDVEMEDSDEPIFKDIKDNKKKDDKIFNDEDDEPIAKTTKQVKRSSKQIESDSDDDFSKENIKHKNKKQRRKIAKVFDDSSEDEEEQKQQQNDSEKEEDLPKSSNRPPKEKISSKLVEEEETFIDEDGYKQTRMVKKIVKEEPNNTSSSQIENKLSTKTKSLNNLDKQKNENIKKSEKGSSSIDNKKSTATKSKQVPKNQASIMSFFKPKNQAK